jgi:hypothetical protein
VNACGGTAPKARSRPRAKPGHLPRRFTISGRRPVHDPRPKACSRPQAEGLFTTPGRRPVHDLRPKACSRSQAEGLFTLPRAQPVHPSRPRRRRGVHPSRPRRRRGVHPSRPRRRRGVHPSRPRRGVHPSRPRRRRGVHPSPFTISPAQLGPAPTRKLLQAGCELAALEPHGSGGDSDFHALESTRKSTPYCRFDTAGRSGPGAAVSS